MRLALNGQQRPASTRDPGASMLGSSPSTRDACRGATRSRSRFQKLQKVQPEATSRAPGTDRVHSRANNNATDEADNQDLSWPAGHERSPVPPESGGTPEPSRIARDDPVASGRETKRRLRLERRAGNTLSLCARGAKTEPWERGLGARDGPTASGRAAEPGPGWTDEERADHAPSSAK